MLTPSCPVPLIQCQCFLLALITVMVSLGMLVTPSQFPPVSECPPQFHYKSLIAAFTSKKQNTINSSIYISLFENTITYT
ncbi:unnamed protein product [Staurois parvus]|uniref:Secreted protein n=1 Tax=Staurois parvus TaxID=386267 RepID=A0ABN9E2H9_9NEOB|nr:unnamed protein product [Staurois parvus]